MVVAPCRPGGYTLTEAVIAIAVLLLLMGVAIPGLRGVLISHSIRSASTDLHATLTLARSEAIMRNQPVSVAPVNGEWTQGWTVTEARGAILRRHDPPARIDVTGPAAVTFNTAGRPDTLAPFEIAAAEVDATKARCVRLSLGGRPAIGKGGC